MQSAPVDRLRAALCECEEPKLCELRRLIGVSMSVERAELVELAISALFDGRLEAQRVERPREQLEIVHATSLSDLAEGSSEPHEQTAVHYVVIEMLGADEKPVAGQRYRVVLPDGRTMSGLLDRDGRARIDGIREPGQCEVCFPDLDQDAWEAA